ncbi:hypothetical protein [Yunchengibacter salinarum]|uniref:hypothetical protein n=1 Tax=Yunchengibacter salinarum TaxID=3133399 RepID=UPI0035B67D1F
MTDTRFSEQDRLVPLRRGLNAGDAQSLRSILEGNGIQVFLANENMGTMGYGVAIDLMIRASDRAYADEVLSKVVALPHRPEDRLFDTDGEERACAHCGSSRVRAWRGAVPTGIPFVKAQARPQDLWFHCLQCDSLFQEKRSRYSSLGLALMWGLALGGLTLVVIWLIALLQRLF